MRIYILDASQERSWDSIVPKDIQYEVVKASDDLKDKKLETRDLLIVHRTGFLEGDDVKPDLMDWLKNKTQCYILFISGVDLKEDRTSEDSEDGRMYRRRIHVQSRGVDKKFSERLEKMCHELVEANEQESPPQWEIIEPTKHPEYLVAAYIIRYAQEEGLELQDELLPSKLWEKAQGECVQLSGKGGQSIDIKSSPLQTIREILAKAESSG